MQCSFVIFCLGMAVSTLAFDSQSPLFDEFGNKDDQPDSSPALEGSGNGADWSSDADFPGDSISGRSAVSGSSKLAETTKTAPTSNEAEETDADFPGDSISGRSAASGSSKPAETTKPAPTSNEAEETDYERNSNAQLGEGNQARVSTGLVTDPDLYSSTVAAGTSTDASTEKEFTTVNNETDSDIDHAENSTSLPEKSPREDNAGSSCALSFFTALFTLLVSIIGAK